MKRNRHSVERNKQRSESEVSYPSEKRCSSCKAVKPACEFHRARREKNGLKPECKACAKAARHDWYVQNAEREKQKVVEWQKANPEKTKAKAKCTYFKNHETRKARNRAAYDAKKDTILATERERYKADPEYREKRLNSSRQRYISNPDAIKDYQKRHRRENPEKHQAWTNNRRSRVKEASGSCSPAEWREILEHFGHCCAYCLRHQRDAGGLTVDHIDPISKGGTNDPDNLVPACQPCNSSKINKSLLEFLAYRAKHRAVA